jgi:uncharacterized membrane protein YccC
MIPPRSLSRKAEALAERLGLSYDHLLGFRFAVNVLIASAIVWYTVRVVGDSNPMWALASMVAAADPQPGEARRVFRSRLINVAVGCVVGFAFLTFGSGQQRMVPVALAVTVLISSYLVRVRTMWRQAPITAAVVIAAGLAGGSSKVGLGRGLHKVAEVLFGCVVGILVSLIMSKVWLVRPPAQRDNDTEIAALSQ